MVVAHAKKNKGKNLRSRMQLPPPQLGKDLVDLIRNAKTQQSAMAVVIQSNGGRERERGPTRGAEADDRREIMGGVLQPKAVTVAQAAIHLSSGGKVFAAKNAGVRTCRQ